MADETDKNSAMNSAEVMASLPPPKKNYTRILPTDKAAGEGQSHFKSSAKAKGKGGGKIRAMPKSAVMPKRKPGRPKVSKTKRELRKEIQKLGRGYEKIFELLEEMQGTLEFKKELVEYAVNEMKRFKSGELIRHFEQTLKKIDKHLKKDKKTTNM